MHYHHWDFVLVRHTSFMMMEWLEKLNEGKDTPLLSDDVFMTEIRKRT
ncbi:hypothetical protein [Metabacillus arenae]|uniref:Uncharacterized protein n=1 Tax=Metabacillus arenae TaxID=2771434 RepID=A0A926NJ33_9BACI|nr:hypothetical protein [Metabacillus arenae]MBD1382644.1 hypothetical protein [Metabacillus arenae]